MSGAQSISTRRAYGVQRVCRVWHRARSSVYARRQATRSPALCRRRGPIGAAPDDVLVAHIRRVLEASPFHGEGYRKAWAKLRVAGMRTSKERVRRLMREHDLQAPPRAGHAHGPKAHDGTITTEAPDVMWGTDMTATVTVAEGAAFVFVAVDHCATACIGLHAAKRGNRFEALEPIRQGIRVQHGDRYFVNNDDGDLIIAQFTPEGYVELDRTKLIEPTSSAASHMTSGPQTRWNRAVNWSHPAYANRHIFQRNDKELIRVSLAAADY